MSKENKKLNNVNGNLTFEQVYEKKYGDSGKEIKYFEFNGVLSDTLRVKAQKKSKIVKGSIFSGIGILALIFLLVMRFLIGKDGSSSSISEKSFVAFIIFSVIVVVVCCIGASKNFFPLRLRRPTELTVLFDVINKEIVYVDQRKNKKKIISANGVREFKVENNFYSIKYGAPIKEKGQSRDKKFTRKSGTVYLEKSMLVNGKAEDFEKYLKNLNEDYKNKKAEYDKNAFKFALISIIVSVSALAVCYPAVILGRFLVVDFSAHIFDNVFDGMNIATILTAGLILCIGLGLISSVVGLFGIACMFLPIPALIIGLVFSILQIRQNRRWWAYVSLITAVLCFAGSLILILTSGVIK